MRFGRAEVRCQQLAAKVGLRAAPGGHVAPALDWHAQAMRPRVDLEDKRAVFDRLGRL